MRQYRSSSGEECGREKANWFFIVKILVVVLIESKVNKYYRALQPLLKVEKVAFTFP